MMLLKKLKEQPAEDSVFLRVLWFILAMNCLVLIKMVDPATASLSLAAIGIPFSIPLMVFYMWLGIAGCFLSYHHRHAPKQWLIGLGLIMIAVVIGWFLDNLHHQFMSGMDIDVLLPTVHLVAGLWVSHTFEMRTRIDFNFSLGLSLVLVFMTATLGKGLLFGLGLLVYVCLAGIMLLLDCESRTFGAVCARKIDGMDFSTREYSSSDRTGNLVFPISCMVALGVALFIAVPRAESLADEIAARFFGFIKPDGQKQDEDALPSIVGSMRSPIRLPRSASTHGPASMKPAVSKRGADNDTSGTPDRKSGSSEKNGNSTDAPESDKDQQAGPNKPNSTAQSKVGQERPAKQTKSDKTKDAKETAKSKEGSEPAGGTRSSTGGNSSKDKKTSKPAENASSQVEDDKKVLPEALDTRDPAPRSDEVLFSVECNRTVYFRKTLLDTFDGRRWYCSDTARRQTIAKRQSNVFWLPDRSIISVPPSIPSIRLKQQYHFEKEIGSTIPVAGSPDLIEYDGPSLWLDVCGTIHSGWALVPKSEYTAVSLLPMYKIGALRAAPPLPPDKELQVQATLANFLQIEETVDSSVKELAEQVGGKDGNWFCKAEKIAHYLRKNCVYNDGQRHDRKTRDTLNHFILETKSGDCKDFASALVILCRSIGIPCRFVNGFTAGDFDARQGRRIIRSKHSHAWAEVYVPRGGWVPFDATPDGTLPERGAEAERYLSSIQDQLKNTFTPSSSTPPPIEANSAPTPAGTQNLSPKKPVSVLAVMLALCFPSLLGYSGLMFWRSLKGKKILVSKHPASKIYRRFLHKIKALGIGVRPSQTPGDVQRQVHERIAELLDRGTEPALGTALMDKIDSFIDTYNEVYFGAGKDLNRLKLLGAEVERLLRKM